jgi:beta-lactam-binding protein with PASTA domain
MRSSPLFSLFQSIPAARRAALACAFVAVALLSPSLHGQGCPSNAIVCENQLTGNLPSEWDISGAGDTNLQGFATDISVNKGETVHFKVDTPSSTFQVDIYRIGWYAGRGARKVAALGSFTGINQPNCLTNGTTGLIDCGNWTENASWSVPSTAISGIYIARLSRSGGGASHIAFVVRDDSAQADLLFQTSDETWQAYNTYGGNSLYVGGPATNPSRAYKVSYNRPITTRATSPEDWVFNAEYPMVRWLEANGYNVSYFTGVDTDRYGATELFRHKAFLSVGHDEYWSAQQRANVEAARNGGVHLAFFSGNEMFWKTRWETSIDGSNMPYRTLVSYKETHANAKIDPMAGVWTGTWRDPRFSPPADGGRPENAVTGTLFTVNCCTTTGAIKVTSTYASQPFWRNTRVAALTGGASTTLTAGTLGYEWDENVNNGYRPAGLTALSSTTLSVDQKLQDYGSTYAAGTATHVLTLYRHASGALVFGAGTVQWSWGLDGMHDRGGSNPDLAMQQATVNLFADMGGIQPSTLQSGLVPGVTDTVAPTVSLTSPAAAATVSGLISVAATAADNVGVASVQFLLDGVSLGTVTSSPYTVAWDTTAASNGTHTLTAVAKDGAGLSATSSPVAVTVSNAGSAATPALTIDAVAFGDRSSLGTSSATSAFSTTATNELLLAFVGADDTSAGGQQVSGMTGGGLTWTLVRRTATQRGDSEVWRAFAAGVLSNVTVTATLAQSAVASITVVSFKGADPSGTNGSGAIGATNSASGSTGAPTASITTTRANSWVLGVGNDWDSASAHPAGAGQTTVHQFQATTAGDSFWVQRTTNATATAGTSVPISNTSPTADQYNLTLVEVLPAPVADLTAPTVTLTAPAPGATVSGPSVTVSANASDDVGVVGVQFLLDNNNLGNEVTTSPYSVAWNTAASNNGSHTLSAIARDAAGHTTTATPVTVTVANGDTIAPTVSLTAPNPGTTVSGAAVTVSANASDDVGVVGVQFKLDNVNIGGEVAIAPYSIAWDSTTASNGSHTLTAVARDAVGHQTTSTPVVITTQNVDAVGPTVSITSPTNGATVANALTITATATDASGVAGVQFKVDGVNVGAEVTSSPYTVSASVVGGSHQLTAVARDNTGNTTTSAVVTVTASAGSGTALTINGAQTFQTIDGLGVNLNSLSWKNGELIPALDMLVDQLGATSWRVVFDMEDWESTNDNADPATPDWTYYKALYSNAKFQNLWGTLHYLNGKGVTSRVALSFMGRVPVWMGDSSITKSLEDEWVEMMSTLLYYARNTEHVQFDMVDPMNETDGTAFEGPWEDAASYARLLNKLSVRLDAMGLSDIRFLGPSTTTVANGVGSYIPQMLADPVIMNKVDHFSLHDYSGSTGGADALIKGSAYPTRDFWMTEYSLPQDAFALLGANASGLQVWEAYDSVYNHAIAAGRGTVAPNDGGNGPAPLAYDSTTGVYTPRQVFYQMQQLFKFVPSGSLRVSASASNANLTLLSFRDPVSGRVTIVGRNIGASTIALTGTLSGVAAVKTFTTYRTDVSGNNFARGSDAVITNNAFYYVAPVNSYFTLTGVPLVNVTTPAVIGLSQAAASTAISGASLMLGTVTTQSSTTVAPGLVVNQSPAAATQVPLGSSVNLVVSTGVTVPSVVGQTQSAASNAITAASLTVGTVTTQSSGSVPSGSVISQSPAANAQVSGGSAVNLVVSTGPVMVAAPDVVGLPQAQATTSITGASLVLGTVTTQSSTTVAPGVVISQSPAAATQVAQGSAVNLVVSTGVAVPNVVNQTQAAATTTLTNASLIVGTVTTQSSGSVPSGSVISQSPAASAQVAGGTAVNLVISTGPAMVAAPNVAGLSQAAATTAITGASLVLGTVTTQSSTTVAPGLVISQSPVAATQVLQGSAVNLVVSTGVTVPNVVNQTQAAATTALTNASLTVGTVTTQSSATVASGSVISQSPAASTQVAGGSAVNLVVSTGPSATGPTVDATVSSDGMGTRVTPAFSTTAAGDVLLAFGASDGPSAGGQTLTVSGAGLTWTLVRRANTRAGTSEIWRATATGILTNATVQAAQSASGYRQSLTVVAFRGASGVGASAIANGATGAPTIALTTTKANSLVFGVGNDWDNAVARTVGSGQTMIHQYVDSVTGDTYWVQRRTAVVATSGTSVTINDTAPTIDRWNYASVEIVP